jgi:hypothetical protein
MYDEATDWEDVPGKRASLENVITRGPSELKRDRSHEYACQAETLQAGEKESRSDLARKEQEGGGP